MRLGRTVVEESEMYILVSSMYDALIRNERGKLEITRRIAGLFKLGLTYTYADPSQESFTRSVHLPY